MGVQKKHIIALPFIILLLSILFITLTATSTITSQTTINQNEFQKYMDDAIDEITSYLKIQQVYGKYTENKPFHLSKIAILATPLFHKEINISIWIIQVQTKDDIMIYTFNKNISSLAPSNVFSHQQWKTLLTQRFSLLSIQDPDESLTKHHSFSEPSDLAFFIFSVEDLSINKGDKITLFLSPGTGVEKTISFQVPLPTKTVANLW